MATTELAIESCNSMRCPSQHHHGHEGCCKTIPAMHVDVGQPSAFQGVNHFPVVLELPTLLSEACRSEPERIVAELSHAPPIFCSRLLTTRTPSSYLARPPAARWDHHLCWRNVVRFRELFCDCRGRCLSFVILLALRLNRQRAGCCTEERIRAKWLAQCEGESFLL
jgi:hypothetical protein